MIPAPYNIGKQKNMFVLEDETERGLDYDKGNPTEGFESIFELNYYDANKSIMLIT